MLTGATFTIMKISGSEMNRCQSGHLLILNKLNSLGGRNNKRITNLITGVPGDIVTYDALSTI